MSTSRDTGFRPVFDLYDRKRLRLLSVPTATVQECPSEVEFLRWLKSRGAPADVRIQSRSLDSQEPTTQLLLWSSEFEPVPADALIPEWSPEREGR